MLRRVFILLLIIGLFLAAGYVQEHASLIARQARAVLTGLVTGSGGPGVSGPQTPGTGPGPGPSPGPGPAPRPGPSTTPPTTPQAVYVPATSDVPTGRLGVTLCFRDPDGLFLVPISRLVEKNLYPIRTSLTELIRGPAKDSELFATVPNLDIKGLALTSGGLLRVDFGAESMAATTGLGSSGSALAVNALIQTLSAHPSVRQIQFLTGGQVPPSIFHGVAADQPFPAETPTSQNKTAYIYLALFTGKRAYVVPEKVDLDLGANATTGDAIKAAVEALTKESRRGDYRLYPTLPQDVRARKVTVEKGVATLDMNSALLTAFAGDQVRRSLMMDSLVLTATAFTGVSAVQFLVDGQVRSETIGHMNIAKPIPRPRWVNPELRETR